MILNLKYLKYIQGFLGLIVYFQNIFRELNNDQIEALPSLSALTLLSNLYVNRFYQIYNFAL